MRDTTGTPHMNESDVPHFEGHDGRWCGEHHTTGRRAWCFDCTEWCYPEGPCRGCELPGLRAEVERLRAERDEAVAQLDRIKDALDASLRRVRGLRDA